MSVVSPTCMFHSSLPDQHQKGLSTISSEVDDITRSIPQSTCRRCHGMERRSTTGHILERSASGGGGMMAGNGRAFLSTNRPEGFSFQQGSIKSSKCSRSQGWRTSKFFGRTVSSGEILRGLKKLSLSSSGDDSDGKSSEGKSLKTRLSSLRKKSSYGSDESTTDSNDALSTSWLKGEQKLSRPPSLGDSNSSQRSSQDDGIVCKKEDLLSIISGASRRKSSPSSRRLPLRQTRSASFEPSSESRRRKEPVRRAGSEETPQQRRNYSLDSDDDVPKDNKEVVSDIGNVGNVSVLVDANYENVVEDSSKNEVDDDNDQESIPDPTNEETSNDDSASVVKWDESDIIDAELIGDAIESYLKGSMSGIEKKVSFRKT